ncbi:hypothetical protein [Pontivivens ytuae]|uniref:Uncharacterized protein n=1 Tax=Pontivivens ytuae TaxID=2789856 RepID=A0A7S9LU06_9RHOB|nr:hypothetical protein [Pontivivens ytuae]QPH54985.1 hypothetical protein I0K15_04325 [Pontivivens ytuae]
MSPAALRRTLRWFHIVLGLAIGTFFYSPLRDSAAYESLLAFGLIPLAVITGLAMWQQGRLNRLLSRKSPG